jgi:hypothetical protein
MFNLVGEIFDQYDDSFEKVASDIRKSASLNRPPNNKHAVIFRDHKGNSYPKYPLDSETNTSISIEYFEKNASKLPMNCVNKVAKRIMSAGNKYGLEIPFGLSKYANIAKQFNPEYPVIHFIEDNVPTVEDMQMKKTAAKLGKEERNSLPDSTFGLVINNNGKKVRKFPMHDENHVQFAISMFGKTYKNLPPKQRTTLAKNIRQKAKQYNINISETNPLNKYAGVNIYPENLHEIVEKRVKLASSAKVKEGYKKLYKVSSYFTPDEFAERMEKLDKVASLDKYYAIIGTPEEAMNNWIDELEVEKTAAAKPSLDDLYLVSNDFDGIIEEDTAEALLENPDVIWPELPIETQDAIWQKIRSVRG